MDEHEQCGVQAGDADERGDHGDEVEQAGLLPGDLVAHTVPPFMVDDQRRDSRGGDPKGINADEAERRGDDHVGERSRAGHRSGAVGGAERV
ncbi:hypothetical protein JL475_23840 [Streptomyces sp. M2CJ-2]|uniref:hypothetical protein n=1 Tax=Streptomyces sp. M2CJ-2 TaxID=2803948 RepID=UPI0019288C3D|nr:hypothetical protein [Streptomyces sp. M2CJ-2]MBL3668971.1 hypothetical protein [Streptomyces sp. M2CJ-2]